MNNKYRILIFSSLFLLSCGQKHHGTNDANGNSEGIETIEILDDNSLNYTDESKESAFGNWEKDYYVNDFDEPITDEPYIQTEINEYDHNQTLNLRFNIHEGFSFWITGEYASFYPYDINFKIKTNGEVYSVPIDDIVDKRVFIYNEKGVRILSQLLSLESGESIISVNNTSLGDDTPHRYLFKIYHPMHFKEALRLLNEVD